ncbi:MAG TPA: gliding motility lipoprotein GldJ, partial [Flavobacteriales bacterium]|nr:gliding motility lipoprotein GldJ [Flavobacteriales bacterium]
MKQLRNIALISAGLTVLSGCQFEKSGATGWNYNDSKNGGFEKTDFTDQENGPGLILIEGGQFTM